MLQVARIFGNDMVLQQGKVLPVWGTAAPGAQVTVTVQGKSASATAGEDGAWIAQCGPLQVSFQETMVVSSQGETKTYTGVQVGEVWLAGGQSNMEFYMRHDRDMKEEAPGCENSAIRFFDYPEVSYPEQIEEAPYGKAYAFWRRCNPENLEYFSAVAYYFAKELQRSQGVPVGIVGCNWGGTAACSWMDEAHIQAGGGQAYLDEYAKAVEGLDLEAYDKQFRENPRNFRTDILADPFNDLMMFGTKPEEMGEKLKELGIEPPKGPMVPVMGPKNEHCPGALYRAMLSQVAPYGLRGVIYYQGESDGDAHPDCYRTLFPALIQNWRDLWGEELPFFFVQLAPLDHWMMCKGAPYAIVREAQQHTADTVPHTGMASIGDVGMAFDIHPKKKQPVGYRLALLAENRVYGENVLCDAPRLVGGELEQGKLTLQFDHAGEGLELRSLLPDGIQADPARLGGLQVFQNGHELPADQLSAKAQGDRVVLEGEAIQAGVPTQVCLATTGWYAMNLCNSAGIPAVPAKLSL